MGITEEPSDFIGRWFAAYDDDGMETFAARLSTSTKELEVAWTVDIRATSTHVAEIQRLVGASITSVSGIASDGIERAIKAGRFHAALHAAHLARVVGGTWTIEAVQRTGLAIEVWNLNAKRVGD